MSKFCANCGGPLAEEDLFCGSCGSRVQPSEPVPAPAPEDPLILHPEELEEMPADTSAAPAVPAPAPEEPELPDGQEPPAAPLSPPEPPAQTPAIQQEVPVETPGIMQEPPWMNAPLQSETEPKKKLSRGAFIAIIASAALVVAVVAASLLLRILNTPEGTVEKFLAAMENGDFASLSALSHPVNEELTLTEENTAPLFLLYQENSAFRESLQARLAEDVLRISDKEDPDEDSLFYLEETGHFLFYTSYQVAIDACSADISSDLACTVQVGSEHSVVIGMPDDSPFLFNADTEYFSDYHPMLVYNYNRVRGLLPGKYTLRADVTNSLGQTLSGTGTLEVLARTGSAAQIDFDYQLTHIHNSSAVPVTLRVDGKELGVLSEDSSYMLGPVSADTVIEAAAELDGSPAQVFSFRADDSGGFSDLFFKAVENDSPLEMTLNIDGAAFEVLSPGESCLLAPLAPGTGIQAVSQLVTGEDVTRFFLWDDLEQTNLLSFELCEVEIENPYAAPIRVERAGAGTVVIAGGETALIDQLLPGDELTIRLYDTDVTEPLSYTCSESHGYLYPDGFTLTEDHLEDVGSVVQAYIDSAVNIYNYRDVASLEKLTPTELSAYLLNRLKDEMSRSMEGDGYEVVVRITPQAPEDAGLMLGAHGEAYPMADVSFHLPFDYIKYLVYPDGDEEQPTGSDSLECSITVEYTDGSWQIAG